MAALQHAIDKNKDSDQLIVQEEESCTYASELAIFKKVLTIV